MDEKIKEKKDDDGGDGDNDDDDDDDDDATAQMNEHTRQNLQKKGKEQVNEITSSSTTKKLTDA